MADYHDHWIDCDANGITIRGYYFPWGHTGERHIAWSELSAVRVVTTTAFRGRARIWGTANPGIWASYDPGRMHKHVGLVLDLGARVKPFITPDDPEQVLTCIRQNSPATVSDESDTPGPLM